jgi:hypothetical protein
MSKERIYYLHGFHRTVLMVSLLAPPIISDLFRLDGALLMHLLRILTSNHLTNKTQH